LLSTHIHFPGFSLSSPQSSTK